MRAKKSSVKSLVLLSIFIGYFGNVLRIAAQPVYNQTSISFEPIAYGGSVSADLDNDRDLDLIFTGQNKNYQPAVFVYENNAGTFVLRMTQLPGIHFGNLAAGDYDNDGDADILISGSTSQVNNETITSIFRNDGNFVFAQAHTLTGLSNSFVAWFDADNDEDLDFIATGLKENTFGNQATLVYKNTGSGFELVNSNLPDVWAGAMDMADVNGDGKIDILIMGVGETGLYIGNGDLTFSKDVSTTFRQMTNGASKWGDLDHDGDLDLLLNGWDSQNQTLSFLYENKKGHLVERPDISLLGMGVSEHGGTKMFDYNNDGKLDLLITGRQGTIGATHRLYKNNGAWSFSETMEPVIVGLDDMALNTGDFDNDGDLDITFQGYYYALGGSYPLSGYYRNTIRSVTAANNTTPQPPLLTTFSERAFRKNIWLAWGEATDTETPAVGLTYNFRLRDATRQIIVPSADGTTGYLRTANPANGYGRLGFTSNMPEGLLYYAVQSIDGARVASAFSGEKSFYHFNGPETVSALILDDQNVTLTWIDNSDVESNYNIDRSLSAQSGFAPITSQPLNTLTYTDHFNFLTETYYYYRINASNANYNSPYDSLVLMIPERTTNIKALSINASKIQLSWNDNSNHETGFRIERKKSGVAAFETVTVSAANAVFYEDNGLEQGTLYEYRVWALSANGGLVPIETTSARTNYLPIGTSFEKVAYEDESMSFTREDFDTNFTDSDAGDHLTRVKIIALPQHGVLRIASNLATIGAEVLPADLNSLSFEPEPDFAGLTLFSVAAHDGKDYSIKPWTIVLKVTSVNDPPAFELNALTEASEDFQGTLVINPALLEIPYESGDALTFTLSPQASDIVNVTVNSTTGVISLTSIQNKFGTVEFTLTANDGQAEHNTFSKTGKIIIQPVNDPPVLGLLEDIQIEKGMAIDPVKLSITDVDNIITEAMLTGHSEHQQILKDAMINFSKVGNDFFVQLTPEKAVGATLVIITANDGIASVSTSFLLDIFAITAAEPDFDSKIMLFPNPVNDRLSVTWNTPVIDPATILITDCLGRVLIESSLHEQNTTIDMERLPPGLYVLKLMSADRSLIQRKIVKQ